MRLVLIGPRGCGKSTIGPLLAARLAAAFVDLDDLVAATFAEPTIREIWAVHGEAAWRGAELSCLTKLLGEPIATSQEPRIKSQPDPLIISLGGGAPAIPEAQTLLALHKTAGLTIIYLKCPVELLVQRLRETPGDRPSIQSPGKSITDEVAPLLAAREPIYEALADVVVDGSAAPDQVVETILSKMQCRDTESRQGE